MDNFIFKTTAYSANSLAIDIKIGLRNWRGKKGIKTNLWLALIPK